MRLLVPRPSTRYGLLTHLGARSDWFKDDRFLRDLEGDSVDTEILDEELRSLQDDEPTTCRGKTVKVLESNPLQIVLCFLVLVDAGVVIAEILLDLHAIRGQFEEANSNLHQVLDFVKFAHIKELDGYGGNDVDRILHFLYGHYGSINNTEAEGTNNEKNSHAHRRRRSTELKNSNEWALLTLKLQVSILEVLGKLNKANKSRKTGDKNQDLVSNEMKIKDFLPVFLPKLLDKEILSSTKRLFEENIELQLDIDRLQNAINKLEANMQKKEWHRSKRSSNDHGSEDSHGNELKRQDQHGAVVSYTQDSDPTENPKQNTVTYRYNGTWDTSTFLDLDHHDWQHGNDSSGGHNRAEQLLEIAHILHYCSIAILGIFVGQVVLKIFGMGLEFFKKKMEIFDAVIILASFALDLVFLEGIGGAKGEEAAALLIVFLLWRILRVINGIMVTAKKRQEFRIKLQKRARRRADKKIEILEEDKHLREKEIAALKELCSSRGAMEDEIAACKPRRRSKGILSRLDTSMGLTSVASLSLSLSMSMSGGVLNMARAPLGPVPRRVNPSKPAELSQPVQDGNHAAIKQHSMGDIIEEEESPPKKSLSFAKEDGIELISREVTTAEVSNIPNNSKDSTSCITKAPSLGQTESSVETQLSEQAQDSTLINIDQTQNGVVLESKPQTSPDSTIIDIAKIPSPTSLRKQTPGSPKKQRKGDVPYVVIKGKKSPTTEISPPDIIELANHQGAGKPAQATSPDSQPLKAASQTTILMPEQKGQLAPILVNKDKRQNTTQKKRTPPPIPKRVRTPPSGHMVRRQRNQAPHSDDAVRHGDMRIASQAYRPQRTISFVDAKNELEQSRPTLTRSETAPGRVILTNGPVNRKASKHRGQDNVRVHADGNREIIAPDIDAKVQTTKL